MTRITISTIALTVLMTSSCAFGSNAAELPLAYQPGGASVTIKTGAASYAGELVEVTDGGLLLREKQGRIILVPFQSMKAFAAKDMGSQYEFGVGGTLWPEMEKRMKAISHFPQGTTPDIKQRLLAQAKQSDVVVAR